MSKSDAKRSTKSGRYKKKGKNDILSGADDHIDYQQSTWSKSPPKQINNKPRSFEYSSPKSESLRLTPSNHNSINKLSGSLPDKPDHADLNTKNKSQEMIYHQLNNRSMRNKVHNKSSSSALHIKKSKDKKKKWGWRSRTSDPSTKDVEEFKKTTDHPITEVAASNSKNKNLIIKINHINKTDKNKKQTKTSSNISNINNKNNVIFDVNAEQQILGDVGIHVSSYNQLIAKNDIHKYKQNQNKKILGVGWKKIYSVLDQKTLRFWDNKSEHNNNNNTNTMDETMEHKQKENDQSCIVIYLSEILTLSKSIRSIDGEKYIIELNVCGLKCLLSFHNIEQREYWHSLLSDYHLNYFVWRSTPLDEKKRRSQNVINGVYKLLSNKSSHHTKSNRKNTNMDTLNILYIEEILQKVSALNITKIIDMVPTECKFMSGRLVRVIMSIKFFFMSVLKSLSGADIPLPSRDILIGYLDEIAEIKWNTTSKEVLDFYCDKCYRILFNLSFAFTSNARDEIMKLNEYIDHTKTTKGKKLNMYDTEKKIAEMKFEYESLQRSWKMHRDRLQEYVMAYRDAVAKLKHSYHQRDNLCKKIETLQQEKKQLNESIQLQNKTYNQTMEEAQKLTQKFSLLSQQMQSLQPVHIPAPLQQQVQTTHNNYQNHMNINQSYHGQTQYQQYPHTYQTQPPQQQQQQQQINYNNNYQPGSQQQQINNNSNNNSNNNNNNTSSQIQQISQEMTNLFTPNTANDKYTWI